MAEKKMTKKEMFAQILANYPLTDKEKEFVNHEIELLNKKNAPSANKTLTPAQKENEATKNAIVELLNENGGKYTITDLIKNVEVCNGMTNQKVSALVRQLTDSLVLVRTEEKGKAYFALA